MSEDAPEIVSVTSRRIACDGGEGGHPRVWLQIPLDKDWVECPYCDIRFVFKEASNATSAR